jgi:peptide deformylase
MSKIVTAPNDVLGKKAKEFDFINNKKSLAKILKEMKEALLSASDPKGVGLAAPQIGISQAIFMTKPTEKSPISVFINPIILEADELEKKGKKRVKKLEGCLSLPDIWGEVLRSPSVKLSYFDRNGNVVIKKFSGFMATIVQHETDHLNGILFPKHVLEQKGKLYKSYKNEKNEDEFEELTI